MFVFGSDGLFQGKTAITGIRYNLLICKVPSSTNPVIELRPPRGVLSGLVSTRLRTKAATSFAVSDFAVSGIRMTLTSRKSSRTPPDYFHSVDETDARKSQDLRSTVARFLDSPRARVRKPAFEVRVDTNFSLPDARAFVRVRWASWLSSNDLAITSTLVTRPLYSSTVCGTVWHLASLGAVVRRNDHFVHAPHWST